EGRITLGDPAPDEIARCGKVVDAERPDIHIASDREQSAGPRAAEHLLVRRRRGAKISRAAAARNLWRGGEGGAGSRCGPGSGPARPWRRPKGGRAPSPRTSAPSGS